MERVKIIPPVLFSCILFASILSASQLSLQDIPEITYSTPKMKADDMWHGTVKIGPVYCLSATPLVSNRSFLWFLTRVTEISNPNIEYFRLPIRVKGDTSTTEEEFERTMYLPETKERKGHTPGTSGN